MGNGEGVGTALISARDCAVGESLQAKVRKAESKEHSYILQTFFSVGGTGNLTCKASSLLLPATGLSCRLLSALPD